MVATRFEPIHVKILSWILGSLDVEPAERDTALRWMNERVARRAVRPDGWLEGNVEAFPSPGGWPYDLTDDALIDSINDPSGESPARAGRRCTARRDAAASAICTDPRRRYCAVADGTLKVSHAGVWFDSVAGWFHR